MKIETSLAPERLLRADAVAEMVGLSRPHLYVLMRRGQFPRSLKIGMRGVRWKQSEVLAWIDQRRRA
ncbi:MAG: helix-turn-helix transcriptional regulator [Hyphomicrobiaceae bacterium]